MDTTLQNLLLSWAFVLLSTIVSEAQTARLEGTVRLPDTTTPVVGAFVYIDGTDLSAVTDVRGDFILPEVAAGQYDLVATGLGYRTVVRPVKVVAGQTLRVQLEMDEAVIGLPPVVVEGVSLTGGLAGLKDIPGSAHYLSPLDLEKFSYTDINRTLRAVPGVNLQEEDGFGLRPNIGLRGTGSERSSKITVMEDGVLAAPAPYAAPAAYYFPAIGRMQAVEVLKGSSQIRFGPYTTGGAINLISTAIPDRFSGRMHLLGGSYANRNLHTYAGNSHRNFAYLAEAFQYQSGGFKKLDNDAPTGFDKKDYLAKIRINTGPKASLYQSLTFKIGQSKEVSDETYLGLTESDFKATPYRRYAASQKDQMNTSHEQFALRHVIEFSKNIALTTTLYRNNFHRNWYKLDKVVTADGEKVKIAKVLDNPVGQAEAYGILTGQTSTRDDALRVKANNRTYFSEGIQTALGWHFHTGSIRHQPDLGIRLHRDEIDRFQWVDAYAMDNGTMKLTSAGTPGTESNRVERGKALAAYLQYKLKTGKWTFVPGLRHENILLERMDYGKNDPARLGTDLATRSNQVAVWIPGIGLDYRPNAFVSFFGGVHKGFSPPGSKEETAPEQSTNYELGARYRKGALSGQAVLFFNDYDNLLGADLASSGGSGSGDLFNGGEVKVKGLEWQLSYDLLPASGAGWSMPFTVVYTYTDARFQNSFDSDFEGWGKVEKGDELPYLPNHQLTLLLNLNNQHFHFNISGRYQDAMRTRAGQGALPDNEKTDAHFILDANAGYTIHKNVVLFASLTNATDKVYVVARRPAGLRPGMPRAFVGGLKVRF
ncbi:MAG TPA: TonB-dependent receptor [Bacteroidetes bacterium]|nr:TonB-dependent receptor [Bacteroidota bacterium]